MLKDGVSNKTDLYGGDILKIASVFAEIVENENNCNIGQKYESIVDNLYFVINTLLDNSAGWMEINLLNIKIQVSSRILINIDKLGFKLLDSISLKCCQSYGKSFILQNLEVEVKNIPSNEIREECYNFPNGSICIPESGLKNEGNKCIPTVATYLNLKNNEMGLFPEHMSHEKFNSPVIVSLSIKNGREIILNGNNEPIVVTFKHPKVKVTIKYKCI